MEGENQRASIKPDAKGAVVSEGDDAGDADRDIPVVLVPGAYAVVLTADAGGWAGGAAQVIHVATGEIRLRGEAPIAGGSQVLQLRAWCTLERCGDGAIQPDRGEECDDGATDLDRTDGDGCSAACRLEFCGDGAIQADPVGREAEGCDDGNDVSGDGCTSDCQPERCGDGVVQPGIGEACDGGGGCGPNCQFERCGDDIVQAWLGEDCDDGNNGDGDGDGCDGGCRVERCGDGIIQAGLGENCDSSRANLIACESGPAATARRCGGGCSTPTVKSWPSGPRAPSTSSTS